MSTENNVISLEHSIALHVENTIIDVLSNRGGKWVGQHIVYSAADGVAPPNMKVITVVNSMIADGILEKSHQTVLDHFDRAVHLPLYRLVPKYNF